MQKDTGRGLEAVSAYVMLADPSYLAESLTAYYPYVDRIVLSYDEAGLSWTGTPLPVQQCLAVARSIDVDGKCVEAPGHFARLDKDPFENDTYQRQAALDAASESGEWVLQLDTDEVMLRPESFFAALRRAADADAGGLDFPSRWLYSRVAPGRYLEQSESILATRRLVSRVRLRSGRERVSSSRGRRTFPSTAWIFADEHRPLASLGCAQCTK